jgi:carboxypeptidase Taq
MKKSLRYIYQHQKELSILGGIAALLGWDQMTYMPLSGTSRRSEQSAFLSHLIHEKVISDTLWYHLTKLSKQSIFDKLSNKDQIVIQRLKKDVHKARKVPSDFIKRVTKTTTMAYSAWEYARKKKDFSIFSSLLEKIIELELEYCHYINIPGHLYDNLLDDYEEGMTTKTLQREFSYLKKKLITLLKKITSSTSYQKQQDVDFTIPKEIQQELCQIVLKHMKLPKKRTRIDVSTHPFTTSIGYDDVRITTNFERDDSMFSFFSTVHEGGHALYELGLPRGKFKDTIISDAPSLGIHESQSRFWENMIAKNKNFWDYFLPLFRKKIPNKLRSVTNDEWYRMINQVKPSLIRVEADELTYCLHIILRFDIEIQLIEQNITVHELPHIWNEKMEQIIGLTPENDTDGVLQDMHWSGGSFGYFPTYAIGSIYAAQLFQRLTTLLPEINIQIKTGTFSEIVTWLHKHVYQFGRTMSSENIIQRACGEGLNSKIFLEYLQDKYFKLYLT